MSLKELQSNFQEVLLADECADNAGFVCGKNQAISAKMRLNIYHNAYRVRLIETLNDTFEHTAMYLGCEWFENLAKSYVQNNGSVHNNISLYGANFANHLLEQLPEDKEVAELAHMDWTLRRAFDGKNSKVVTQEILQEALASESEELTLLPVPTLSVSKQEYNTLDIWHAINHEQVPPEAKLLDEPIHVLTWRKEYSPHFRSLSATEALAIERLRAGDSLDEIGEALTQGFPENDIATEFGLIIARWLEDELLAAK